MTTFFRVCNNQSKQGLWYNFDGTFTGLIHNKFNFCENTSLKMDFDPKLVGWLSATQTLDDLFKWFSKEDIRKLQEHGWFITEYQTDLFWFYQPFQHWVICQENSKPIKKHIL